MPATKVRTTQADAVRTALATGRTFTADQLTSFVARKTRRNTSRASIIVLLSNLKTGGLNIESDRGSARTNRPTKYRLAS